jgi:hypothetical protein
VVRRDLASVTNELESANDLADGEEAQNLGKDDAASGDLSRADIPYLLDDVLGGLDEAPGLDGLEEVLVGGLESGQVAVGCALAGCPAQYLRDN